MQNSIASRFVAGAMIFGTVFGMTSPAFAAPATPVNLSIVGGKYTNDTTPTFTWTPADGATWYEILLDDGEWRGIGNVSSYTYNTLSTGWHTFYLRAHDNANGVSVSTSVTFEIDTQGPVVSAVTPTTATAGVSTRFYITSTGEAPTAYCKLRVNGVLGEKMYLGSPWSQNVTLNTLGKNTIQATCVDTDNNWSNGPMTVVEVSRGTVSVDRGTVVKTQCSSYAPAGDACHAVYYYDVHGKKHLFPTESVYKSWYSSFDNVVIISKSAMAAMPTGEDVTYRPGTSLVKFSTSSTVYAVAEGQVLRPIVNEAAAKAIYGSNWNSYVVTIPTSQRDDYTIGKKISSSADYSRSQERSETRTVDELWSDEECGTK